MSRQPDSGIVENFFRRDGRLNRLRYFKRNVVLFVVELIILTVITTVGTNDLDEFSQGSLIVFRVFYIAGLIPFCCLMIRRLHDLDMNETLAYVFFALSFVTVFIDGKDMLKVEPSSLENALDTVACIINLYTLFWPGTNGDNSYGSDPLKAT